ncbi:MAG: hypothetical protein LC748_11115, partial [Thermomicrobia bacterium]|nr:hypothetical protein [Thermomicrobia bacterium]
MPIALHVDHDVPIAVSRELGNLTDGQGAPIYMVETARSLRMTAAPDYDPLLQATQHGCILITCNWRDFQLLHGAWKHWSHTWGVRHQHLPILVI